MKNIGFLYLIAIVVLIFSCTEKGTNNSASNRTIEEQTAQKIESNDTTSNENDAKVIFEDSFEGFKIGDSIDPTSPQLKKHVEENGEGSFDVFVILDEDKNEIGMIYPKSEDSPVIQFIEITSAKFKTEKGIGIGSTFKEVKAAYPNVETHGSEIESRTSSTIGGLSFLLNAHFSTYNIDESKIKPSTEVLKVTIHGK